MLYEGLCLKTMTAGPTDPLTELPPHEFRCLEAQARAELLRKVPSLRALLARGRCPQIIARRMRALLVQQGRGPKERWPEPPPPPPDLTPWVYPDGQP